MKIQLVHPPVDDCYGGRVADTLRSPPIGLELIACNIPRCFCLHDIEVIDGNTKSMDQILSSLDADVVGVSDWFSQHVNAMRVLERAKANGSVTVVGGHNASNLADRILNNHPYVDCVVVGDGEGAFRGIIWELWTTDLKDLTDSTLYVFSSEHRLKHRSKDFEFIPNVVFRENGKIVHNDRENADLDKLFSLEHIDDISYVKDSFVSLSSVRGCYKAEKSGRCSYCSIKHPLRIMDPELVWKQIGLLNDRYGISYFFESGDDFLFGNYAERVLEARPDNLSHVQWRFFASPLEVTPGKMQTLKALNTKCVFLGVDSMDENVLRLAGKQHSVDDSRRAVELLSDASISLHVPFMYGLPGESVESLEANYQFAKEVSSLPNVMFLANTVIPVVGSGLFSNLARDPSVLRDYPGDLSCDDVFDYEHLFKEQLRLFTSVDYGTVMEYVSKTNDLLNDSSPRWGLSTTG